jgi:hypothetical protein
MDLKKLLREISTAGPVAGTALTANGEPALARTLGEPFTACQIYVDQRPLDRVVAVLMAVRPRSQEAASVGRSRSERSWIVADGGGADS